MSESILDTNNEKAVHKQGPNWDIVGRYEDFTSADTRRHKEIADGRTAKVHHLSTGFVVKVKPTKVQHVQEEAGTELKTERATGKQKRQNREEKN